MSVLENVMVGGFRGTADRRLARARAEGALRSLDMWLQRDRPASALTLPDRKRLEVARALATEPRLLLLDEVMAGLRPTETDQMVAAFRRLNAEQGVTILLIEHVMRAVMALAQRVYVLHHGEIIASGTPQRGHHRSEGARELPRRRSRGTDMLAIRDLSVFYGDAQALDRVSLEVGAGQIGRRIVGANGAGKTSLIRTIAGILAPRSGSIVFDGHEIGGLDSHRVCNLGVGQVAEGRQVFPTLTVLENLEVGAMLPRARAQAAVTLARVFAMFPRLQERAGQLAGTLSGGEQQMLAIGRCLMGAPRMIMFDEPSLGLSPALVGEVLATIRQLHRAGHDHPAGRAERRGVAAAGRSRLRARERQHRARRQRRGAARRSAGQRGVPGFVIGTMRVDDAQSGARPLFLPHEPECNAAGASRSRQHGLPPARPEPPARRSPLRRCSTRWAASRSSAWPIVSPPKPSSIDRANISCAAATPWLRSARATACRRS